MRGDQREFVVYCALPCFCFWLSFSFLSPSQIIKSLSLFIFIEISMTTLFFRSGARGGTMSAAACPEGEFCAVGGGSCFPYFDRMNSHPSSRPSTQQRKMRRAATRRYSGLQKGHEGMEDERSGKNGG